MNTKNIPFIFLVFSVLLTTGCSQGCTKPQNHKRVFFVNLSENASIPSSVFVKFGLEGMRIRPAGEDVADQTSGHHHILIDEATGFIPEGQVVPMDERHIHYGKGQTEDLLKLTPGAHTLTLQLADGAHRSYGKDLAATIHVTVSPAATP
jgi:hypothetical protein